MRKSLFIAAEEARRLAEQYCLEDDERQISAESETSMPELIGWMLDAGVEDEARIAACKARIAELRLRIERYENRDGSRNSEITTAMQHAGITSLDTGTYTVSLRSTPPAVRVYDVAELPPEMVRTVIKTEPDKVKIKRALEAGETVPGASLGNGQTTLSVRRV